MNAEKPFEFGATPGKLPKQVVPEEYAVRVTPDLAKHTFAGSETVKLNVHQPVRQLVLNAFETQVTSATVDGKKLEKSAIKLDPKQQTLTLILSSELAAGPHTLDLSFSGKINQQGQGLFYAPYQEQGTGAKKTMLGTQFEATDARRFFPCWDEPSFRARFQLTVVVPENFTAMSNMPVEKETKVAGGKEVRFATTPPMASYLNVFCAGELDRIEANANDVNHGVIATKGKAEMGRYALEASQQILQYYNDYFGVNYPLPKLDHIAVPGGFGGAMENWGGITYFESVLLFDQEKSTAKTKQNIYEVIAHETAHMWFGDLVTMAWWDNLWLNEGFASWMGTKCTAHFNSQWDTWLRKTIPRDPARRQGSAGKLRWKAMRVRRRIQSNKRSPRKRKPTARSTTSLIEKGCRSSACSKVFSATKFFVTAFANTWPCTSFPIPPPPIFGILSPKFRANRSEKSRPPGPNSRDFRS